MSQVTCESVALWKSTDSFSLPVSAWLAPFEHPVVDKINQRIEDITGLDVTTAEDLQVAPPPHHPTVRIWR